MYAIIETGGKQYKVSEGDVVFIEKIEAADGSEYVFDKVLAVAADNNTNFGAPYLNGISVTGKVLGQGKEKKVLIFKYKAKKTYRKKQGHRQPYTKVQIEKINA